MTKEAHAHLRNLDTLIDHLQVRLEALGVYNNETCDTLREARATLEGALLPVYGVGMSPTKGSAVKETLREVRCALSPLMSALRWAKNLIELVLLMLFFMSIGWLLAHIMTSSS